MKNTLKYAILIFLISAIGLSVHFSRDAAFERDVSTIGISGPTGKDARETDRYKSNDKKHKMYNVLTYVFSGLLFVFVVVEVVRPYREKKQLEKEGDE